MFIPCFQQGVQSSNPPCNFSPGSASPSCSPHLLASSCCSCLGIPDFQGGSGMCWTIVFILSLCWFHGVRVRPHIIAVTALECLGRFKPKEELLECKHWNTWEAKKNKKLLCHLDQDAPQHRGRCLEQVLKAQNKHKHPHPSCSCRVAAQECLGLWGSSFVSLCFSSCLFQFPACSPVHNLFAGV